MSSVFFKFRNQKDQQRVPFDGTGITVFELKREIITISKLGDGTDFDLILKNPDTDEDYNDDTTIIPRSTSVLAIRRPAARHGHGRAARYVSGRMPVNAKNNYRKEQTNTPTVAPSKPVPSNRNAAAALDNAKTEEERIQAMLGMDRAQWEQQQQHMSTAHRVSMPGHKGKTAPPSDNPPPPGYICYRCGKKGHWIQVCPTNDDPEFENKPRIKRITGIPKSFLKQVEAPTARKQDGLTDDAREPQSVMVDADGNHVVAMPDIAAWQKFRDKADAAAANTDAVVQSNQELRDRGLECPLDKRMFVDPVKTPCCSQTFCNQCIDDALSEHDLTCPHCSTENVLIDDLQPDEDMRAKIKAYEEEKKAEKEAAKKAKSPSPPTIRVIEATDPTAKTRSPTPPNKRKRSIDEGSTPNKRSKSPDGTSNTDSAKPSPSKIEQPMTAPPSMTDEAFVQQMNAMAGLPNGTNGRNPSMPFNPISMPPMMNMPNGNMMNPMMMMGNGFMPNMNMNMNGFNPQQMAMLNGNNNGNGNGNMSWENGNMNTSINTNGNGRGGWNGRGRGAAHMPNAPTGPRALNNKQPGNDDPYMRKPVNPGRHQGRSKRVRQADYRELG